MRYWKAHIKKTWDDSFKNLEYHYQGHADQNMVQRWLDQGYSNTLMLYGAVHRFGDSVPNYIAELCHQLAWNDTACQLLRMDTGSILPVHHDHYLTYSKALHIDDIDRIWRAVVFMEEWKSGHYFEINGEAWVGWRAGDYVVWNNDVPHMAANIGVETRYTLQLTGWI